MEMLDCELKIEMVPLERLRPYVRNLRQNDKGVHRMVASIKQFGLRGLILACQDGLIDGHLRLKAAQKLGLSRVPVLWCDDLTPAQVKALRLLINRSASWASWDEELLALELAELNALGFDLAFTGFDAREIDDLLFRSTESSDNFAPAPAEASAVVTTRGDIWRCGEHRVVCGNATSQEDVKRLQAGVPPGIMITDPPYGISFDPAWRERAGLGAVRQVGKVANDDCAAGS